MSEEVDLEELSREVENLRERVNNHKICLGILGIVVIFLIVQPLFYGPLGSYYFVIIVMIIIPIALIIGRLEQRGL